VSIAFYSVNTFGAELHPRMAIIAALAVLWGTRLTYNFYRKGGYALSGEDYRWKIIQDGVNPIMFQIFNIVFIAFIQNVLLASIVSPVYVAWTASYNARNKLTTPLNEIDYAATALALTCLIIEAVADQQQWNFQTAKYAAINAGKRLTGPFAKGFIDTGLFKYSRHPNFFAEQCFWWSMCLFATAATGKWTGWWMGGAAALTALFQGSTWLTEKITAEKYPKYKEYQQTTSRLMLWFPGKAATGTSTAAATRSPRATRRASVPAAAVVAAALAPVSAEEDAIVEVPAAAAAAAAPRSRGRSTTRRASAPAKKTAASRSRSAPAKKAVAAPKKKAATASPAKKPAAARSVSRGAATKKASTAPKKAAAPAARRTTRSRA
jgi:steroid 5-alpha reductase family enzyme